MNQSIVDAKPRRASKGPKKPLISTSTKTSLSHVTPGKLRRSIGVTGRNDQEEVWGRSAEYGYRDQERSAGQSAVWPLERIDIVDVGGLFFGIERSPSGWEVVGGFSDGANEPDESIELETGHRYWSIRRHFDDRTSLVKFLARDSQEIVVQLNAGQEDM
jgi:hypothetical protein